MKSLIIYPGTFNPLHRGHLAIAQWAQRYYSPANAKVWKSVYFDVANGSYDKDSYIQEYEFNERCRAIHDLGYQTYITNERSFLRKEWVIRELNDTWYSKYYIYFLVGIDTAERIDSPDYYCGSEVERTDVLDSFDQKRTRFVVFPRAGKEYSAEHFSPAFQALAIKAEGFTEVNMSSSELRAKENNE